MTADDICNIMFVSTICIMCYLLTEYLRKDKED